jgi:hypothetical protein
MEQVKDPHAKLGELFMRRDAQYRAVTDRIFEMLPTVCDALYDLFELPHDQVEWNDIDVIDDAIVIQVTIMYTPTSISPFVQMFAPSATVPEEVESISQLVRVGIPAHMAFAPKDDIIRFFRAIAAKPTPPTEHDVTKSTFNMDTLTPEQQQQLLLSHLHDSPGSKH